MSTSSNLLVPVIKYKSSLNQWLYRMSLGDYNFAFRQPKLGDEGQEEGLIHVFQNSFLNARGEGSGEMKASDLNLHLNQTNYFAFT